MTISCCISYYSCDLMFEPYVVVQIHKELNLEAMKPNHDQYQNMERCPNRHAAH
jgi:hypothetical protein